MENKITQMPVNNPDTQNETGITTEQVEQVVTRKQGHRDIGMFVNPPMEPGVNRAAILSALEKFNAPKIDINNPEQLQDRIDWYFRRCAEKDEKPGVVALANAIGISRKELWAIKVGERGKGLNPDSVDRIKKAYDIIEETWEIYMATGKINPASGIFLGKNHYGYKDQTDVVVTPNNPYDGTTESERAKKYLDGIVTDDMESE